MASFAQQVKQFTEHAESNTDKVVRAITFALFRDIIRDTPVDKGRLKGNWITTQWAPSSITVEATDKSGGRAIAGVATNMGGLGSITYMVNNLPYAYRIEFEGWSHTKAPEGMVRRNFARIDAIVRKSAGALR